jgi:hypothetical protein
VVEIEKNEKIKKGDRLQKEGKVERRQKKTSESLYGDLISVNNLFCSLEQGKFSFPPFVLGRTLW